VIGPGGPEQPSGAGPVVPVATFFRHAAATRQASPVAR
jgi:hypothetical protein